MDALIAALNNFGGGLIVVSHGTLAALHCHVCRVCALQSLVRTAAVSTDAVCCLSALCCSVCCVLDQFFLSSVCNQFLGVSAGRVRKFESFEASKKFSYASS